MRLNNTLILSLFTIFVSILISGCKSTVDQLTMSTCKAVETNIAKCSQLIADDISNTNKKTLSSVNEGDL